MFWVLGGIGLKLFDLSEHRFASNFRVTEMLQVAAGVIRYKECNSYLGRHFFHRITSAATQIQSP
jgi:hypothetical protein